MLPAYHSAVWEHEEYVGVYMNQSAAQLLYCAAYEITHFLIAWINNNIWCSDRGSSKSVFLVDVNKAVQREQIVCVSVCECVLVCLWCNNTTSLLLERWISSDANVCIIGQCTFLLKKFRETNKPNFHSSCYQLFSKHPKTKTKNNMLQSEKKMKKKPKMWWECIFGK